MKRPTPSSYAAAILVLSGLTGGTAVQAKDASGNTVIAVEFDGLRFPYQAAEYRVFQKHAQELGGIKLIEADSGLDPAKEMNDVASLLLQKPDCFLMLPVEFMSPAATEVIHQAGVPVISFDVQAGGPINAFVGYDQNQAGQLLAQFVIDWYKRLHKPQIKVMYLRGIPGHPADTPRDTGFKKGLSDAGLGADKVELFEQFADWDRAKSESIARDLFTQHPDIDLVIGLNDDMTLGAEAAAAELNIKTGPDSHVHIMGVDGLPEGLQAVAEGKQDATAAMNPIPTSVKVLDACMALTKGEKISDVRFQFEPVTRDGAGLTGAEQRLKEIGWVFK